MSRKQSLYSKLDSADTCCEVQIVDGQGDVDGTYMLNTRFSSPPKTLIGNVDCFIQSNSGTGGGMLGLLHLHQDRR